ncbi:recombination regulator RecX [Microtetraspora sp. AC03309]|nr:recombination regulator RecX [Microtetraspora sp. AC03309]
MRRRGRGSGPADEAVRGSGNSGPTGELNPADWNSGPWGPEHSADPSHGVGDAGGSVRGRARGFGAGGARGSGAGGARGLGAGGARGSGAGGARDSGADGTFGGLGPAFGAFGTFGADDDGGFGDDPADRAGRAGGARRKKGRSRRSDWSPDGPDEDSPAAQAPAADPQAVARAICLRLLTMAPKTRAQLAEALRKREVPEDAAQAVLERFSEVGLIDDEAFAAAWVSSRHAGRGLARRALAQELRHRGVDEDTVKEAVEQLDPEQEVETARRLVARKLAGTRGVETQARTRRLVGMLARKGYGPGLAFRVVREALESEGAEIDDLPDGDMR